MPKSSNRKHETRRANRDRRQRLEELRRQQKAAERRKNWLFAGSAIIVAAVLIGAAVIPTWMHDRAQAAKKKVGYQAAPTSAEKAAGCTGVHNDPISAQALHVPDKPIDYRKEPYGDTAGGAQAIPPSSGKHNPVPLGDKQRFYSLAEKPRAERAVHNLEHGYVVAWYDDQLPADQVAKLKTLAANPALSRLLVVGWTDGELPLGKHVVLTSWGRTDRCATVSDTVVKSFYADHVNSPLAPEAGSTAQGGEQFPADSLKTSQVMPTGSPSPSASASAKAKPQSGSTKKSGAKK